MKPGSAKDKGRRLQQHLRDRILATFEGELQADDVRSTSMGAGGEDVLLSPLARQLFPFSGECKNVESLNVWKAFAQATANAGEHRLPLLVFKRNRSEVLCALRLDDLLTLLRKLEDVHQQLEDELG